MKVTFKKDEYVLLDDTNKIIANYIVTKGAKGDTGAGEDNIIEDVKVNNNSLPVTSKSVNIDLTGYVEKETGKGLSTNDYTTAEKNKLAGIEASADVNVIENIKVNGVAQTITNKAVDISVPINTSDLNNDSDFVTATDLASHLVNVSNEADEDYRVNFIKSKNLFDEVFRQGNTGNITTTNRIFSSSNIYLTQGVSYTISTNLDTSTYKYAVNMASEEFPTFSVFYDSGWETSSSFTFTPTQSGYFGLVVAKSNGTDDLTPSDISSYHFKLEKGSTATSYEPFRVSSINVDNETFSESVNVGTNLDSRSRVNVLHSRNVLKPSLQTTTLNGITITNNGNGTYTLNGTANAATSFDIFSDVDISSGTYKLVGCPAGGSDTTYYLAARYDGVWGPKDIGDGTTITFTSFGKLSLSIQQGVSFTNVIVKPMLTTDLSATYDDYEPYTIPSINVDGEEIYSKPVVLWTNPSPSSAFASQTIDLASDDYNYYEVIFKSKNDEAVYHSTGRIPYGLASTLFLPIQNNIARNITTTGNKMTFGSGYYYATFGSTTVTTNNNYCIPYQIIGYK